MALIKNQTLVEFTGRIGKTVFKKRGSVKYLSALPRKYPKPMDENSVYNRNQLFLISKLAGLINAVDLIKMIWKMEFPDCFSTFHEMSIANYHHYKHDNLRGCPILTPKTGFPVHDPSFEIVNSNLIINSSPLSLNTGIDFSFEKSITSATLFLMNSHLDNQPGPCFNIRKGITMMLDSEIPVRITTNIGGESVLASLSKTLVKLWSIYITLDKDNKPVRYSEVITWPSDVRKFLNDDIPNEYMKKLRFPNRKSKESRWSAESCVFSKA